MRVARLPLLLLLTGCVENYLDVVLPEPVDQVVPGLTPPQRELPPLVEAPTTPPPVSGGTLFVDGAYAIAAEPDRDLIHVARLAAPRGGQPILQMDATIQLGGGDEPGRVTSTGDGRYWVALRGSGDVVQIAPTREDGSGYAVAARHSVCAAPRGIAYDSRTEEVLVACLGGDLVGLNAKTGVETSRRFVDTDLRDVVVTETKIFVSRFRSAEILVLNGEFTATHKLDEGRTFRQPNVAYRMVAGSRPDTVLVSHQLSSTREPVTIEQPGGYGGGGGGFECRGSLVSSAVSAVDASGNVETLEHPNVILPLDLALSPVGTSQNFGLASAAIVSGGATVDDPKDATDTFPAALSAQVAPASVPGQRNFVDPCFSEVGVESRGIQRTTAVAYTPDGYLVRQTQNPHRVIIEDVSTLELPGPSTFDTGHDLFFGDAGGGIACASCHAEGADDGMTWNFVELGPRRTQEIRGGIMDTAPFHWDGDMNDLTHLTHDVMGERMSGPELPADYVQVLARWMDNLKFPAREVPADLASVERGREIFHSAQAACASCHSDDRMGADAAFDVGTGIVAHVPGLMGVSLRPPFMHTGCAQTMRDRFAPGCGGTSHGSVAHLDEQGLSDLIVYLESL